MPNQYPAGSFNDAVPEGASAAFLADLASQGLSFSVDDQSRAEHGRDWWPPTIAMVARGEVPYWPGVVVRATSTDDVSRLLVLASRHQIPVTPQGGRSSVVGGAVAPAGGVALDLTGLNRVLDLDDVSGTVRVEAGLFGPELERRVHDSGWTVGHLPQSFELSTVGGWIACRGAGQYSNRYGKIEDIVRALTIVLANGDVVQLGGHGPRQAVGPDLLQLFIGSEGTLGVITEATLAMHPLPQTQRRAAFGFASFDQGLDACRRILQRDAHPAVLRLYDETESARHFAASTCALIVLDEGDKFLVDATMHVVNEECANAVGLDVSLVEQWLQHRNDVGALAPLWERGYVVDTIEVSGPWSILPDMRSHVVESLTALPDLSVVSVHQSHAYLDGACLYFTFAGKPETDAMGFYRAAWDAAIDTVLDSGGALSHHHGVGRNRARFVERALASAFPLWAAMKAQFDPLNIMNPGVLGVGATPW